MEPLDPDPLVNNQADPPHLDKQYLIFSVICMIVYYTRLFLYKDDFFDLFPTYTIIG